MVDEAAADAPGRVNLIGEHTDYHDGFVLPTTIPQRTRVALWRRSDRQVRASSAQIDGAVEPYELGRETLRHTWIDYVQGVTSSLAADGFRFEGFDVRIDSAVPVGAGVSSSAALEVSLLRGLRALFGLALDDVRLAQVAQRAETAFVGAPVGIMDQMAASLGRDGEALFLDTRTLTVERVPLPDTIELIVIDSGVPHAHAGGEYATRRRESFEAAARLGVGRLRDLDLSALAEIAALPAVLARRARHIVTENQRVLDAVEALRRGDTQRLGALFAASHASMRDDYDTSTPDIDALVRIGAAHPDVYGARLTGGGFGGAVVMIAKRGRATTAAVAIATAYSGETPNRATVLVPQLSNPKS
jgi:galactokinase